MDTFINIKNIVGEFTDKIDIDYDRESFICEINKKFLDDFICKVKRNNIEIVFIKEINENHYTIVALSEPIYEFHNFDTDE
jgi:hypothetical protein